MGSHSVACHPTQDSLVLDLPTPEGCKAELIAAVFKTHSQQK